MNGRRPVVDSIYTRNSSISSHRPSTAVSSISTKPSAQQLQIPTRTAPLAPAAPSAVLQNGVLLLNICGAPSKDLKSNLHTALSKGRTIGDVLVIGDQKHEQALKQFKVELYGLAGSLKRELGVSVLLQAGGLTEEEYRAYLNKTLAGGNGGAGKAGAADRKELHGVLCELEEIESQPVDAILDVETDVLMNQWQRSVGAVHTLARCTVPMLRVAAHRLAQAKDTSEYGSLCPFFATRQSRSHANSGTLHDTALRALLDSLSTLGNHGITFGSAEALLTPDPEPTQLENQPVVAPTNGWREQDDDFSAGESPTKMWSMWSDMQDQLGNL